jgi:hypothetical protein
VNAILGGVLKSESFVLSQSFYFGPLKDKEPPQIVRLDGICIDELQDPPEPVFPGNSKSDTPAGTEDADDGVGDDRSVDLFARMCRDLRAGLADYEILWKHRLHPRVA